jgi:hypothetical protein
MDISGRSSWIRPPGFQEAAVASSATAIKAPPIPNARAPCPTGLKDEGTSIRMRDWAEDVEANPLLITNKTIIRGNAILRNMLLSPIIKELNIEY